MNQNGIVTFTKYLLNIMFYSGILVVISLPYTIRLAGRYYSRDIADNYIFMLTVFLLSGICGLIIVYQLRRMVNTVILKDCFVESNTRSLKLMGKVAFIISLLFFVKMFVLPSPATFIIILTFFIAGIFSYVLGLVFAEAVRYKEENDLTI
nr:DUF2975 domain-containing protein [uncultured Mediterraneibacter sp.]